MLSQLQINIKWSISLETKPALMFREVLKWSWHRIFLTNKYEHILICYKSKPFFLVVNCKLKVFPILLQQTTQSQMFSEETCKLYETTKVTLIKSRICLLWIHVGLLDPINGHIIWGICRCFLTNCTLC